MGNEVMVTGVMQLLRFSYEVDWVEVLVEDEELTHTLTIT